jgi:hypothetical protein
VAPCGIVTLLTDFGAKDPFVGVMKGVILSRFPAARIVDLTHGIEPQDVAEAGFWLESSHVWFPRGSVHLAVVDPGVGTARAAIAVAADGHYFVAPDNGLLTPLVGRARDAAVRTIDLERLQVGTPSRTFHGRDVLAPAAADLASGRVGFAALGPRAQPSASPFVPVPSVSGQRVEGVVVAVDRFGNLITNVDETLLREVRSPLVYAGEMECPVVLTYMDASPGEYVALVNSSGRLEVARCLGNAAAGLGLGKGSTVRVVSREAGE